MYTRVFIDPYIFTEHTLWVGLVVVAWPKHWMNRPWSTAMLQWEVVPSHNENLDKVGHQHKVNKKTMKSLKCVFLPSLATLPKSLISKGTSTPNYPSPLTPRRKFHSLQTQFFGWEKPKRRLALGHVWLIAACIFFSYGIC